MAILQAYVVETIVGNTNIRVIQPKRCQNSVVRSKKQCEPLSKQCQNPCKRRAKMRCAQEHDTCHCRSNVFELVILASFTDRLHNPVNVVVKC